MTCRSGPVFSQTRKLLAALARHPNAVLVLSLGCENLTHEQFVGELGEYDPKRVKFVTCQQVEDEMAACREALEQCAEYAGGFEREEIPSSELVIGMKCGGSDGLSGITANPVVGRFSDMLVAQGGSAPIMDVIGYGDAVTERGLNMLYGPGNDLVSSTALTAAGAHMILFTTGRGTPFGAPAPTMKLSTNTPLYEKKRMWIDFNTGVVADGSATLDETAARLMDAVLETASGKRVKAEERGFREISIFKGGVTL